MLQEEAANALPAEEAEAAAAAALEAEHAQQGGDAVGAGDAADAPVARRADEQPQRGEKALQADDPTLLELLKQHRCVKGRSCSG